MPLPSLSAAGEEEEEKKESVVVSLSTSANADDGESGGGLYADAEERAFYEQLPDLRAVLPAVLFSEEGDADTSGLEEAMRRLPSCSSRREVDDPRLYCTIPCHTVLCCTILHYTAHSRWTTYCAMLCYAILHHTLGRRPRFGAHHARTPLRPPPARAGPPLAACQRGGRASLLRAPRRRALWRL